LIPSTWSIWTQISNLVKSVNLVEKTFKSDCYQFGTDLAFI